jgi:hypothetical protein
VCGDLPAATRSAARVDGNDHALGAERGGCLGQHVGTGDGGRVERDLLGTGQQQPPGVLDAADAAADG